MSGVLALGVGFAAAPACAGAPTISDARPGALVPGRATDVVLGGSGFVAPLDVRLSFAATYELLEPLPPARPADNRGRDRDRDGRRRRDRDDDDGGDEVRGDDDRASDAESAATELHLRITTPAGTPVGVVTLWVATPDGLSAPFSLLVDDLPSVAEAGPNQSFERAQPIVPPIGIDARVDGALSDFYRFRARRGVRLAFDVFARRLGADLDPILRLVDGHGRELGMADDDESLGADCRYAHTFAADGEYFLEVRDVTYRSRGRYRLRIGDFPLATVAYPLAASAHAGSRRLRVLADRGEELEVAATPRPLQSAGVLAVDCRATQGGAAASVPVLRSNLPETLESEPNDTVEAVAADGAPLRAPGAINGRFERAGDRDVFRLPALHGVWSLRVTARRVHSPSHVTIAILDAEGRAIRRAAGEQGEEARLQYDFGDAPPATATSPTSPAARFLEVEELLGRAGPAHAYRVAIEPAPPLTLTLRSDKDTRVDTLIPAGGALALRLACRRLGHDAPVALEVEGIEGARVWPQRLPAGAGEAEVVIQMPAAARAGAAIALRLRGHATVAGSAVDALAGASDVLTSWWPDLPAGSPLLEGPLLVAVAPAIEASFEARLAGGDDEDADRDEDGDDDSRRTRRADETTVVARFEGRGRRLEGEPRWILDGLPAGFSYEAQRRRGGGRRRNRDYEIRVRGPRRELHEPVTIDVLCFARTRRADEQIVGAVERAGSFVLASDADAAAAAGPRDERQGR